MFLKLVFFFFAIGVVYVHGQQSQANGNRPPSPGRRPPVPWCPPGESYRDGSCQKSGVRQKRSDKDSNSNFDNPGIRTVQSAHLMPVHYPEPCEPGEILLGDDKESHNAERKKRSAENNSKDFLKALRCNPEEDKTAPMVTAKDKANKRNLNNRPPCPERRIIYQETVLG